VEAGLPGDVLRQRRIARGRQIGGQAAGLIRIVHSRYLLRIREEVLKIVGS